MTGTIHLRFFRGLGCAHPLRPWWDHEGHPHPARPAAWHLRRVSKIVTEVSAAGPYERGKVQLPVVDALAQALHAVARALGAPDPDAPPLGERFTEGFHRHVPLPFPETICIDL